MPLNVKNSFNDHLKTKEFRIRLFEINQLTQAAKDNLGGDYYHVLTLVREYKYSNQRIQVILDSGISEDALTEEFFDVFGGSSQASVKAAYASVKADMVSIGQWIISNLDVFVVSLKNSGDVKYVGVSASKRAEIEPLLDALLNRFE